MLTRAGQRFKRCCLTNPTKMKGAIGQWELYQNASWAKDAKAAGAVTTR